MPDGEMPSDIKREIGEKIYAGKCKKYIFGNKNSSDVRLN
jgi:hypothetical protein